jgi:cathepsin L
MKFLIVLALVYSASAVRLPEDVIDREFNRFQREFGRQYNGVNEESYRRMIFEENINKIVGHNLEADNGRRSFRLAVNQFTDMTNDEFRQTVNGYKPELRLRRNTTVFTGTLNDVPATVDWRTKGVVTPIKNQEQCGSCWAFSAVAGIEGQHALNTKKLVSLSEQNLVDCSAAEGNQGCNGGLMDQAFEYVIKNRGIDTESSYPYKAEDEKCEFQTKSVGATLSGFTDVKTGDETALKAAVATIGPISVAIDASSFMFQFYSSGVYDDSSCGNQMSNLDHGVTAVGYGTLSGKDYWLVKNSWGTTWGEKGYIQMSRNKDNQCGIATAASYPTGVKSV